MGSNLEYITGRSFNSSFKNMLRDYYVYGFKDREAYSHSIEIHTKNDRRLNDFLKDYMEWSKRKERKSATSTGENVTFITCDSQAMPINPFHRLYRFCGTDRPDYLYCFFHTIAALNSKFQLTEGTDTLGLCGKAAERFENKLNVQEKQITKVIKSMHLGSKAETRLEQYYHDEELLVKTAKEEISISDEQIQKLRSAIRTTAIKLKTSDLKRFFAQKTSSKTVNNRLQRLREIGVVHCSQTDDGYVFSDEQIEQVMTAIPDEVKHLLDEKNMTGLLEKSLKNRSTEKPGDHNWYLPSLTFKRLLDAGQKEDPKFRNHFQYALDFYSKTFLFGEVGTFLLDRMGVGDESPIRVKHEYYMHSLNDFNAIDLMAAIENNQWCMISYKREETELKILCYPIELRISVTNGREYLMYYEPFKRSCAAIRLEFIESIQYYPDCHVKKCLAAYRPDTIIDSEIDQNLSKAKLLMEYTWGVSTGEDQEKNIENLNSLFQELRIRIAYNKDSDYYILNRLYRESRIGVICVNEEDGYIDFSVVAADINEVIPFLRSFYSRVMSCTGFNNGVFSAEMDIKRITGRMVNEETREKRKNDNPDAPDDSFLKSLGDGINAKAHEKLFNEMFSAYYHIFAAIFAEICSSTENYTEKEICFLCKRIMYKYKDECGSDMLWESFKEGKVFADMLRNGGFLLREEHDGGIFYKSKYETNSLIDLYGEVIPLSEIEIRWLKTIICDEKIHYFLKETEILAVKLILTELAVDIKPFPMGVVNYYDRYKFSLKKEWKESTVLAPILDAISSRHIVKLKYVSNRRNVISGNYKPIVIEYSKRDNCFKGYFLSCRRKEGLKVYNLAQCISVDDTEKDFDYAEVKSFYDRHRDQQMDKVDIEFEDDENLADQVLTEFSPWKKCCRYDSESGVYHLTIYYQKQDGKEVALRLLEFGTNVCLTDPDNRLSRILKSRLEEQTNRISRESSKSMCGEEKDIGR